MYPKKWWVLPQLITLRLEDILSGGHLGQTQGTGPFWWLLREAKKGQAVGIFTLEKVDMENS